MKNFLFWFLAVLITISSAVYQRITGPTYPLSGSAAFAGEELSYSFARSHEGDSNHEVSIVVNNTDVNGYLEYRKYKFETLWHRVEMERKDSLLYAEIPGQPPAGKIEYAVVLKQDENHVVLPAKNSVVIRFKGVVPDFYLIPHILFMFAAMLLSTRTAFEALKKETKALKKYTLWTLALMLLGGLVFGPIIQLHAFGELWTGIPFGHDLTDNKTLIAFLAWVAAFIGILKMKKPKWIVIAAAVVTFIIFLIPHSVLGSELDYSKLETDIAPENNTEQIITDTTAVSDSSNTIPEEPDSLSQ